MASINIKCNRDETLAGDVTFEGLVTVNSDIEFGQAFGVSMPTLAASHAYLIPVLVGGEPFYVKVFDVA